MTPPTSSIASAISRVSRAPAPLNTICSTTCARPFEMLGLGARADHGVDSERDRFGAGSGSTATVRPLARTCISPLTAWAAPLPPLPQREPVNDQRDCSEAEPLDAHRSGGCWEWTSVDGGALGSRPGGALAATSRMRVSAIRSDDPADQAAPPVDLGVRVLRPADLDAHPGPFGARRAIDDVDIARLARFILASRRRAGRRRAGKRRWRFGTMATGRP